MNQPTYKRIDGNRKRVEATETIVTSEYIIEIRPGFIFDGASIPVPLRVVFGCPFTGKHEIAALAHDAVYASESMSRAECDAVFLELLEMHDNGPWKSNAMYAGVRVGGWAAWGKHTKESIAENRGLVSVRKNYEGGRDAV